jgi:H2-forming N5,N10-methylenetetrahydromethanopterin dehydrogenase-like enzyme
VDSESPLLGEQGLRGLTKSTLHKKNAGLLAEAGVFVCPKDEAAYCFVTFMVFFSPEGNITLRMYKPLFSSLMFSTVTSLLPRVMAT